MKSFSDITKILISKSNINPTISEIFDQWELIVGKDLSKLLQPYKIITVNQNNILVLKAKNCSAIELQHDSFHLLQKINNYFNCNFLAAIRIVQDFSLQKQ